MTDKHPEIIDVQAEVARQTLTPESRSPEIVLPRDAMWPMKMHEEAVRAEATEALPLIVAALSEPVPSATQDQVAEIFAQNPHKRRLPWRVIDGKDGSYTYTTAAYRGVTDARGSTPLYDGVNYTFDRNGRMTKMEYIEGEQSYDRGQPRYQEFLKYDDEGYLVELTQWEKYSQTVTDRFDYATGADGKKVPATMTRTLKVMGDNHEYEDSDPMTVDLANHEEWLAKNPNGITRASKEELNEQELKLEDFSVKEYRSGLLFTHPEQLETALVMYGSGNYPTPGGETALEYNDKAFAESYGAMGGLLFSVASRSNGDMGEFVQSRIMGDVQTKWKAVQKSRHTDASESVHFSFDYDGAGHFHKSHGEVKITKGGLELELGAAYVGDRVEDDLASAFGLKRGLRSATIEVPVNQTEREGYFLVDVMAVARVLGVPVTDKDVSGYLKEYIGDQNADARSRYDRTYGKQPALWQDDSTGVRVELVTQRRDYDSDEDLDRFFGSDTTSIWGPLPKELRHISDRDKNTPRIRVTVEPSGDPFDEDTTRRTDEIIKGYMSRLEEEAA